MSGLIVSAGPEGANVLSDGTFAALGQGDLRRLRISGRPNPDQSFEGNFVECTFIDAIFERINLSRCDWKDCYISDCAFIDCRLNTASLITNSFENCRFERCQFSDTGISNSTFRKSVFEDCDLSNVVMKSNKLEDITFNRCRTSNRVIESSLLIDTKWLKTDIELNLLLGNFGLRRSDVHDCNLYMKLGDGGRQPVKWADLTTVLRDRSVSAMERFRISYFTTGEADGDPAALEDVLSPTSWVGDAIIESSFSSLLSDFSQFLLSLYKRDALAAYAILRLHTHNFELLEWLSDKTELPELYQTAAGVHLALTREVDSFVALVQAKVDENADTRQVRIAANGPLKRDYFVELLDELGLAGTEVVSVRPRNSPIELILHFTDYTSLLVGIALVLACRTKFELIRLANSDAPADRKHADSPAGAREIIVFRTGFSPNRPSEYQINFRTLLPRSLLLDLRLCLSVSAFKRVRSILVDLLSSSDTKKA